MFRYFLLTRVKVSILRTLQSVTKLELSVAQIYCDKQFFNFDFSNLSCFCFHNVGSKTWPIKLKLIYQAPAYQSLILVPNLTLVTIYLS
jgi:hypothetical protein